MVSILSEHLSSKLSSKTSRKDDQTGCVDCGLTWSEFEKTRRLGCPRCYESQKEQLKTLLRRLHGNNRHIGKSVKKEEQKKETLNSLKKKLKKAIENEAYETAAELRDRIRDL